MKTLITSIVIGCAFLPLSSLESRGAETTAPRTSGLGVQISKVEITADRFYIDVELRNDSDQPISLWDIDAEPGRQSVMFIFPDSLGGLVRVSRMENQKDFSGRPLMIKIGPRSSKRWSFDLFDRTWNVPGFIGSGATDLVRVELSTPATDGAKRGEVWAGTAISKEVQMNKTLGQIWPGQAIPFTSKLTK